MSICTKCDKEFTRKSETGQRGICNTCNNKARKLRNRNLVNNTKDQIGCQSCGNRENLEFHHKDPKSKTVTISVIVQQSKSLTAVKNELNKCIILCRECHFKVDRGELNVDQILTLGERILQLNGKYSRSP